MPGPERFEGFGCLLALLVSLVAAGCDRADEPMRVRMRANLQRLADHFHAQIRNRNEDKNNRYPIPFQPPADVVVAARALLAPIKPEGDLEALVAAPDGLVHERYEVKVDQIGFETWGGQTWVPGGVLGATIWRPRWMLIRGEGPSGPRHAVECRELSFRYEGIGPAEHATHKVVLEQSFHLTPRKISEEAACVPRAE